MSPASDPNLIYTFTTYEPYTIGWYNYGAPGFSTGEAWHYVHDIPYPIENGVDYTEAVENAIDHVPDSLKEGIRQELMAYVRGEYDSFYKTMTNHYDSLYNTNWHMLRAKSLDDWRKHYGGNIHIMCVEFGCMDSRCPKILMQGKPCFGISDADRLKFVRDMRSSFDAYDIGWDYWSYNEAHTVFNPSARPFYLSPPPEIAADMFDYDMLTEGLGLKPLVTKSNIRHEVPELDQSWLYICTVEHYERWSGTGLEVRYDYVPSGFAYLAATKRNEEGICIFSTQLNKKLDASSYIGGYLHLNIFVEDVSKFDDGLIEICGGSDPDTHKVVWNLKQYITHNGWNDIYLPVASAAMEPSSLTDLSSINLHLNLSNDTLVGIENFYFCYDDQEV